MAVKKAAAKKMTKKLKLYGFDTGEEVNGPFSSLEQALEEASGYFCEGDAFEVFELVRVGAYTAVTETKFIKQD